MGPLTVRVESGSAPVESRDWSMLYFDELEDVITAIKTKHHSVYVNVVMDGFHDGRSFDSIREFTFATKPPVPLTLSKNEGGFVLVRLDDVFVCRVSTDGYASEDESEHPFFDDMSDHCEYFSQLFAERGEYDARHDGYRGHPTRLHEYKQFREQ